MLHFFSMRKNCKKMNRINLLAVCISTHIDSPNKLTMTTLTDILTNVSNYHMLVNNPADYLYNGLIFNASHILYIAVMYKIIANIFGRGFFGIGKLLIANIQWLILGAILCYTFNFRSPYDAKIYAYFVQNRDRCVETLCCLGRMTCSAVICDYYTKGKTKELFSLLIVHNQYVYIMLCYCLYMVYSNYGLDKTEIIIPYFYANLFSIYILIGLCIETLRSIHANLSEKCERC